MRVAATFFLLLTMSGCTAMVLGGGSGGGAPTAAVAASDAAITARVEERFAANTTLGAFNLGVHTHAGTVTLTGTVKSDATRAQAGRVAAATTGVRAVDNRISVVR